MKRNPFLFLCLVLIFSGIWFARNRSQELRYKGRPIESWFEDLNRSTTSNEARTAFIEMGKDAVPFLVAQLTYNAASRTNYLRLKKKLPDSLRRKLPPVPQIDWVKRENAVRMLGDLGAEAKSAVPELIKVLSHKDETEGPRTIGGTGYIRGSAYSWNYGVRAQAIKALERIDLQDLKVTEAIIATLENRTSRGLDQVGAQAFLTLEILENPSPQTIQALLESIMRGNEKLYLREVMNFASGITPGSIIGKSIHSVMTETNTLLALNSTGPGLREAAAFELGDPDREGFDRHQKRPPLRMSAIAVSNLVECLSDREEIIRLNAADSLAKFNKKNGPVILPTLISLLDSTNSFYQLRTIEILRQLGAEATGAVIKLRERRSHPVGFISVWSKKAIEEIESPAIKEQSTEQQ